MRTVSAKTIREEELPKPVPGPGQALVRIDHVTLCGTDLHIWEDDYTTELPLIQGHELSGTITELVPGSGSREALAEGVRVAIDPLDTCGECQACRRGRGNVCPHLTVLGCYGDGGFAEYVVVPQERLYPIPDSLPSDLAPVAEPIAISLEAVTRGRATGEDTVLVLGAGPIGLLATLALHDLGATVVTADTLPGRLELAKRFGADHTLLIDPTQDFPAETLAGYIGDRAADGPELVIEATGVPSSLTNAIRAVAPAGRVVQVGISTRPTNFPLNLVPFKEVDILGSRNSQGLIPQALELIARHQDTVRSLLTHRFRIRDLESAFATLGDPSQNVGKILIDMHPEEAAS
ncbi:alcohol dehydrogenase catalytic domain-containing protein [Galactobacter sp.]|uniref:zinc-dependent alcohol dehydrogenase n=1 Tax=Galactobacter sp. TaxID=2676125 RepID=UPI0025BFCBA3|nr:alcohol dehydrogenase catalytic domain-containing protein [Galactobacter sp.]